MLGAIAGDVLGSVYERANVKTKAFALFAPGSRCTDDSVLTVALAEALLSGADLAATLRAHHRRYPQAGFGPTFLAWVNAPPGSPAPRSASNGAAMRIAPVGWAFERLDDVLRAAHDCTVLTHDHPDAVAGAQATASAVFLARHGATKAAIAAHVEAAFGYDLSVPLDRVRPDYAFDLSCAGTVPHAIRAFLESTDVEDALRNAISIGGDSDTLACIAGAVAEAFYGGVPAHLAGPAWQALDDAQREVTARFCRTHRVPTALPR
ncbi:MAG: ADP-ribosylglycohydrolase family protein [Piscinibacter sp.]|uniref:ADP-ribosylglycohydrolase family protein n=1 Tax=Piscinibacter sp. TaxID=1903157 RepID=UPI002586A448|nr:ADP-ribosylglycohydrolase family protein [Piscinibacter sp.]MCW5667493.1 ADP-ribosylglycohydrolase family protein [Piscinibacter sp.]